MVSYVFQLKLKLKVACHLEYVLLKILLKIGKHLFSLLLSLKFFLKTNVLPTGFLSVYCLVVPMVILYGCRFFVVLNHFVVFSSVFHLIDPVGLMVKCE
jgi:hypothetical protein